MSLSEFVYTVLLRPKPLRGPANFVLRKILPAQLTVHGARIALNPDDPVVSGALTLGVYEREEIAFFQKHFRPGMTFADVGANVGLYTGMALATPGFSGTILCVEPDKDSRRYLQSTISANLPAGREASVHVCACAASDRAGSMPFFRNPDNHGDNRLYADPLLRQSGVVEVETLDALCARNGVTKIDFLKIDVQGAEGRVIAGARDILSTSPDVILMTEFWSQGLTRCGSDPLEYLAALDALGFVFHHSDGTPIREAQREEWIRQTDGRHYINLFGFKGKHVPAR
ncbi:MAG: FkbM family methyltransferase [Terrimicrobiaceae bacterium]